MLPALESACTVACVLGVGCEYFQQKFLIQNVPAAPVVFVARMGRGHFGRDGAAARALYADRALHK